MSLTSVEEKLQVRGSGQSGQMLHGGQTGWGAPMWSTRTLMTSAMAASEERDRDRSQNSEVSRMWESRESDINCSFRILGRLESCSKWGMGGYLNWFICQRVEKERPKMHQHLCPDSNSCSWLPWDHHSCQHQFPPLPAQDFSGLLFAVCHHLHCHCSYSRGIMGLTPCSRQSQYL